jgi:uncharacterized protein
MQSVAFEGRNVGISRCEHSGHDIYFVLDFPEKGGITLYAPTLRLLADCRLERELVNSSAMGDHLLNRLVRARPEIADELESRAKSYQCPTRHSRRKASFFPLSVAITRNCSLACSYCHADAGLDLDGNSEILLASLGHAVKRIEKEGLKGLHVSFAVGGEPTFRWSKFTDFVRRVDLAAEEKNFEIHKAITTNGYYGQRKREFLASHFDSILLSFDGPQSIHDHLRPTKAGGSSFDIVLQTCRYFSEHAKKFAVRCTVIEPNLERLEEIVLFFIEKAGLREHNEIVLEPMIAIGRGASDEQLQPNGASFARSFWKAYRYGKARGYRVKSSAFNPTRLVTTFCHAMSVPSFAVTVDGKVTACERDCDAKDYAYGFFDRTTGQFSLNAHAIRQNEAHAALPAHCGDCICKWHCAGDCPDTRRFGYDRCEGNQFLLLAYLKEMFETNF